LLCALYDIETERILAPTSSSLKLLLQTLNGLAGRNSSGEKTETQRNSVRTSSYETGFYSIALNKISDPNWCDNNDDSGIEVDAWL
jgi:hypothetical protein